MRTGSFGPQLALSVAAVALLAAVVAGAPSPAVPVPSATSGLLVGAVTSHVVGPGETLLGIGARRGIEAATLAHENGLAVSARLAVGQLLRIDNRHIVPPDVGAVALLVNVPQRMLFHSGAGLTSGYPAGVGRADWQTPRGDFQVVEMRRNPAWHVPQSILEESQRQGRVLPAVVPPGPSNPLGAFWIGLSMSGIGIHGTNAPSSVFGAVSHGCIRLHPDDIAELFARVGVDTRGRIVYEPVLLAADETRVYLEVHRDVYRRGPGEPQLVARQIAAAAGLSDRIDWTKADAVAAARHGVARDVTGGPGDQ